MYGLVNTSLIDLKAHSKRRIGDGELTTGGSRYRPLAVFVSA